MLAKEVLPSRAFRITFVYAVIATIYILATNFLLARAFDEIQHYQLLEGAKDWCFVAVTALGLWVTLRASKSNLLRSFGEVQTAKERLRGALNAADGCSWETVRNRDGSLSFRVVGRLARSLGLPEETPISFPQMRERVHPADLTIVEAHQSAIERGDDDVPDIICRLRADDASYRWVKVVADVDTHRKSRDGTFFGVAFDITDLMEATRELVDVIEGGELGTWRHDRRTGTLSVNTKWVEMLGYSVDELWPTCFDDWRALVHADDLAKLDHEDERRFFEPRNFFTNEFRMRHKEGHWVWIASRGCAVEASADGEALVLSGVHIDISNRKKLEQDLLAKSDFLTRLTETSVSGVLAVDETGRIVFSNLEAQQILDGTGLGLIGQAQDQLSWHVVSNPKEGDPGNGIPLREIVDQGRTLRDLRLSLPGPSGSARIVSVNAAPMGGSPGARQVVCSVSDITQRLEAERQLAQAAEEARYASLHDPLTGLPNREYFRQTVETMIRQRHSDDPVLVQVFLSIDQFQEIKDRFGPLIGDQLILKVAQRLESLKERTQVLARVGADEFTFLHSCPEGKEHLDCTATTLAEMFDTPFDLEGQSIYLTVSLGVSRYPMDAFNADEMWINADLAMYEAKSLGGNRCIPFSAKLRDRLARTNLIGQALQRAIHDRTFQLVLQPKVDLQQGNRVIGAEALIRCTEPSLAGIGPAEFMPVAEKTGLIGQIDLLVLDMVGAFLADLHASGKRLKVSVNLSAESLRRVDFAKVLLERLESAGLGPESLLFELTEGAMVDLSSDAKENIELLLMHDYELSADDFGTGYSSLSYLQLLRLSELKIDRSFVMRLGIVEGASDAIVRATFAMAGALGVRTVAEGIDTPEQAEWLRTHGCAIGQGYLFGKPMPTEEFVATLLCPE